MSVCLGVYAMHMQDAGASGGQKRQSDPQELDL